MLPQYLWKIKVQICDEFRTRSTFSPSVMVSVSISKHGLLMDLCRSGRRAKINGGYYHDVLLSQKLLPVMSGDFSIFQQAHLHTGHATLCNFLNSQHPLSFLQICGRRIALTLIQSITRYVVTSSSKSISRRCTTLTGELKKRLLDVWQDGPVCSHTSVALAA